MVLAQRAVEESDALHHDYVGTGHLLLAMLREEHGRAAAILDGFGVDRTATRRRLLKKHRPGKPRTPPAERPYTTRAGRALEHAMATALEWDADVLDTDHLLLGLLRVQEGLAAEELTALGVTYDDAVARARGASPPDG